MKIFLCCYVSHKIFVGTIGSFDINMRGGAANNRLWSGKRSVSTGGTWSTGTSANIVC